MRLLNPGALWFALIVPAIIIMYLLKRRRRDLPVASIMLWEQVLRDAAASVPWQRLRRNLLLYLQLLTALLLILALIRPALPAVIGGGNVFLLIDTSASMKATDIVPDRLTAAVATARRLVAGLGSRDTVTVIDLSASPRVVRSATRSRTEINAALASLKAGNYSSALAPGLDLACALAAGRSDASLIVLSDGGLVPPPAGYQIPYPLRYERIGGPATNLAIAALATRTVGGRTLGLARVVNHSPAAAPFTLELAVDGGVRDVRRGQLAAGQSQELVWELLPQDRVLTGRLKGGDALALDDVAWAVTTVRSEVKTLLVSTGNIFLEKSLALTPGLTVTTLAPDATDLGPTGYGLYVYDGVVPASLPAAPVLVINPPAGSLGAGRLVAPGEPLPPRSGELLTEFVDLGGVAVAQSRELTTPAWGRVILETATTPLTYAGERSGQRTVVFGFDLHQSNLPLRPAFPILMQNIIGWLLPNQGGAVATDGELTPGDPLVLRPEAMSEELSITTPSGTEVRLAPPYPPAAFTATDELGLYTVHERARGQVRDTRFVVKAPALESALAGSASLPVIAADVSNTGRAAPASRDLWPWLVWLALIALAAEWWVYNRGY
jgi:acyl-CoA hydrolase